MEDIVLFDVNHYPKKIKDICSWPDLENLKGCCLTYALKTKGVDDAEYPGNLGKLITDNDYCKFLKSR